MTALSAIVRDSVLKARASLDEVIGDLDQQNQLLHELSRLTKVVNDRVYSSEPIASFEADITSMETVYAKVLIFHRNKDHIVDKISSCERTCTQAISSGVTLADELRDLLEVIGEVKYRLDGYVYLYEDTISFYEVANSIVIRYKPTRIIVSKRGALYQEKYNRTLLFLILVVIYSVTIYFTLSHSG